MPFSPSQPQGVLQGGEPEKTQGQTGGHSGSQMLGAAGCVVQLQRLSPAWEPSLAKAKHTSKEGERGGAGRGCWAGFR